MSDNKKYYPEVPWEDTPAQGYAPRHTDIQERRLYREGIYGPLAQIFVKLTARDRKVLVADTRVIGTLEPA